MKQTICRLLALLLCLCLLTGCDGDFSRFTEFLTSQEDKEPSQPEQEEDDTQTPPEEDRDMASESVLEELESLETLRLACQTEYGFHPYSSVSVCNRTVLSLLYEPLFLVNSSFEAEPVLASGVAMSQDGLQVTVTLRTGSRFSDGTVMTADDVVYSYEQAKASSYYGSRFGRITGMTALGRSAVVITTDTTFESVALLLDFPIIKSGTAEAPVPTGTGPFVLELSALTLTPSAYWQGDTLPLGISKVELTPCTTSNTIRDSFEYGDVNLVCTDPNAAAFAPYHSDSDYELWSANTTILQYLGFNHHHEIFSSEKLCAAITYVIDRDIIVAEDMGGFALPATLPASPLSPGYDAGLAADYSYDPETFHAALEQLQIQDYTDDGILDMYIKGYPEPLAGTMIVSAASPQRVATANRIADTLNDLGFDITVSPLDAEEFKEAMSTGKYELYYAETRLSANFDLTPFFRSGGSLSYGGLESTTMENLCVGMLENSGNAYDLHKRIMDRGEFCPIAFKIYAVYTTRGAASQLDPPIDWWLR